MSTALEQVQDLEVQTLSRSVNQAAVLSVIHQIPADDGRALSIGDFVTFTDDEVGVVFVGKITNLDQNFSNGEGIKYICADAYRTLTKEPAQIAGTTRIKSKIGTTTVDLLTKILDELDPTILTGGFDITALESVALPELDRAGQSVASWIDTVLKYTDDSVATIIPFDDAGTLKQKLVITRYTAQPDVELEIGQFTQPLLEDSGDPLMENAEWGQSLDQKVDRVLLEGCGEFTRHSLKNIIPELIFIDQFKYTFKFVIPEEYATGRYFDADGNCKDEISGRIQLGWLTQGPLTLDVGNLILQEDESTGEQFIEVTVILGGTFSTFPPPVPVLTGWFNYTSYDGPFQVEVDSGEPALDGEGALVEQHEEFVIFNGSAAGFVDVDNTAELTTLAENLSTRNSVRPDSEGSMDVHIKGLNTDLVIGSRITNDEFESSRVRTFQYNFTTRTIALGVSDQPVRDPIQGAKLRKMEETELGKNWYIPREGERSCLCGGPISTDVEETTRPGGGPGHDKQVGPTWDCVQGICDERDDDKGQYQSEQDCQRDCEVRGADFFPCVGCVPLDVMGFGFYETVDECVADNPDPFDAQFSCGSSGSPGPAPSSGDTTNISGKVFECSGCCTEDGGEHFTGFIKKIKTDRGGNITAVECANCEGFTGAVSHICSVGISCGPSSFCQDSTIVVKHSVQFYSCGRLVSVGDCE